MIYYLLNMQGAAFGIVVPDHTSYYLYAVPTTLARPAAKYYPPPPPAFEVSPRPLNYRHMGLFFGGGGTGLQNHHANSLSENKHLPRIFCTPRDRSSIPAGYMRGEVFERTL